MEISFWAALFIVLVAPYVIYRGYKKQKAKHAEAHRQLHEFDVKASDVRPHVIMTKGSPTISQRNGKLKHPLHKDHGGTFSPKPKLSTRQKVG